MSVITTRVKSATINLSENVDIIMGPYEGPILTGIITKYKGGPCADPDSIPETIDIKEPYYYMGTVVGNRLFISETFMLETMLQRDIQVIEEGDMYAHGYPEGRLTPADHIETCNEHHRRETIERFSDKITDILEDYYRKDYGYEY